MQEKVAVIGAGSWGTSLANLLALKGHQVRIWARRSDQVEELRHRKENTAYLPGVRLCDTLFYTDKVEEAVRGCGTVLCAVPSQQVRSVFTAAAQAIQAGALVVNTSKGIEARSLLTVSEILSEAMGPKVRLATLSGPSFAREVALGLPTAVTAAAMNDSTAETVQDLFSTENFRVYRNNDMVGTEIGGALKNVIAIAAGISDGLGFGSNTKAALITRGLAEITRLGLARGAQAATFAGLAGMGDLLLTCTGDLSRNRHVGIQLGQGKRLQEILDDMQMVAEGVKTTESAYALACSLKVDMPITEQMYKILYHGKAARAAVLELMSRDPRAEWG